MSEELCSIIMMKDEEDILEEYLSHITKYIPNLFILNGSDDETFMKEKLILDKYSKNIKFLIRDKDTNYAGKPRDGWRQYLLAEAHKQGFNDNWFLVGHPDEFLTANPDEAIKQASKNNVESINVLVNIFFLHTSQKDTWTYTPGIDSIQKKMKFYAYPGHHEYRFFKNNKNTHYDINRHSWVLPQGLVAGSYFWDKPMKAYTWRSPEQFLKRSKGRVEAGWQLDSQHYKDGMKGIVFRDALTPAEGAQVRNIDTNPLPIV